MSKFKMPAQGVQEWVEDGAASGGPAAAPKASGRPSKGKQARLTIDLPPQLHAQFKAACAINRTRMVEEVTRLIEDWTQKHS